MSAAPSAPAFRYPVALDLAGHACLVVGGGAVAARKTEGLLEAAAR
jgi:siroheme synthase (precorrin-2 oxidase/ferrochelatase)